MTPVIEVHDVRKSYGSFEALKGINLDIQPGEVFALLGPNGAGKTTLIEILEGYRRRSAGDARVLGIDPGKGDWRWRARMGIVLQGTAVFDELTVEEVVAHFAAFYPAPLATGAVIEMVGLGEKRRARCANLSGGQKRRVDLALGLVGNPELIFLDEPTTGLDPEGRRQLWDVVSQFRGLGKTVVLTTHFLDEAEALADRVGVIIAGEMAAIGTPHELGGRDHALATVRFDRQATLSGPLPAVDGLVTERDGMVRIETASPTAVVAALAAWARDTGAGELPALSVTRPSLEDIYLAMVREEEARRD